MQLSILIEPNSIRDIRVEWACALKEPEDNEAIQGLRHGFASLDNFIANLGPGMWVRQSGVPV